LPVHFRYQLLHRAASAIIEAQRFGAQHAALLVQSFCEADSSFEDYANFCEIVGGKGKIDSINLCGAKDGVLLWVGWIRSTLPEAVPPTPA
jgi:hypothetical protein